MTQTYIGAPIRRREDVRFLTGMSKFVDDVKVPQMLPPAGPPGGEWDIFASPDRSSNIGFGHCLSLRMLFTSLAKHS